ncbi:MAG: single-stranded-DNA-specific exonuclease RecJ [Firmicutes bacterium]|nr:single-stranded-DNA-specific exonuclease RecJ [Bacillota bacterium]MBQ9060285.1 single-stranded-DNA-specific exonuclease RecJ [Bacillota bacterium]
MADDLANTIIRELMRQRGIRSEEDAEEYLSDLPRRTYNPFLMKNMREGTDLILSEIRAGRRICIYGDYDVDGITSVCILHTVLSRLTENLTWYIPSRFTEGYGLHEEAIDLLHREGVGLIITVDCGITSDREVTYAQRLGMRVLVTDHHNIGDVLPDCVTIDPKQEDETYPFRDLAGCGVAYKLAQAIQRQAGLDRSVILEVLDLVASGTVADIVPLLDENRTIVKYGLSKLNERSRAGLAALEEAIGLKEITSGSISYGIAPHLNAAGRMKHAGEAVRLLLAPETDRDTIRNQVQILLSCNAQRKKLQNEAYERAREQITGEESIICLQVNGIHEGIAGIAAGKLKEDFLRPVILATDTETGLLKGTGRSIEGVDLFRLLDTHRDRFVRVGGHKRACGFTISEEEFRRLQPLLEEEVRRIYEEDPSILELTGNYDLEIRPGDVSLPLAEALSVMEPFGEANEQPRFLIRDVMIRWPNYMGESNQHVRFKAEGDGARIQCVLFQRAGEYAEQVESGGPAGLIGTVEINEWNDRKDVQFIVKEIV